MSLGHCPTAPGKGDPGFEPSPGPGGVCWVNGERGGNLSFLVPLLHHLLLPTVACPWQGLPTAVPRAVPAHPWVTPHAGTPLPRGWALSAALGELFSSKTLIPSFRPCPFSPFLFLCLSLPLLLPTSHLCHSDCRVKLWNYVPGLTPCLPRRVLAIKGRATSLP